METDVKTRRDEVSMSNLADSVEVLTLSQRAMAPADYQVALESMAPAQRIQFSALQRSMQTASATESHPQALTLVQARILELATPSSVPIGTRRQNVINITLQGMGFDPVTGLRDPSLRQLLSPKDAANLMGQINRTTAIPFENPAVKQTADVIYRTLTGGSKDNFGMTGTGPGALMAVKAEQELLDLVRARGPGFDPRAWWNNPKTQNRYRSEALRENQAEMDASILSTWIVFDTTGRGGVVDYAATEQRVADAVKAGELGRTQAEKILDYTQQQQQLLNGMVPEQ
jgi:hypothetical protein